MSPELRRKNKQTIFDFERGNCWATCLSCVLDLNLDDVPNFCAVDANITTDDGITLDWYQRTVMWLRQRGWDLVSFVYPPPAGSDLCLPDCWALVTGPSPRNPEKMHVVVCRVQAQYVESGDGWAQSYKITTIHDPHPDDTFLAGDPKEISLLVRCD